MTTARSDVEFNLHDLVKIRLEDAERADVAAVRRQVGLPAQAAGDGSPADITIRFVDDLPTPGLRYLGVEEAAFTDNAFFVLRGKGKRAVKVQIPFASIGDQPTLLCERGKGPVPLLTAITNLAALAKGVLPLHASAFCYRGQGVLITGWAKGGKTETLLGFMARGAAYIGDEWVYLRPQGAGYEMLGLPEPIRIWDWHLTEMPAFRARLPRKEQLRLATLRPAVALADRAADHEGGGPLAAGAGFLRRARPLLRRQHGLNVAPELLFGAGNVTASGSLDKVFFVVSAAAPEVIVEPADPGEIAARMLFSLQEEQEPLLATYRQYRFAFPYQPSALVENAAALQAEILQRALAGRDGYTVSHPYPAPIPAMAAAMEPYLR
jgi:hypothetical protein